MDIYKQIEKNGIRLTIFHDPEPRDPRENDNLGRMVCWHKRHNLGDIMPERSPEKVWDDFDLNKVERLPLFLYDHSGLTISTGTFSCKWDSGQVGWIYVEHDTIKKEYGVLTPESIKRAREVLEEEVKEYDLYLTGQSYGFKLERATTCDKCQHTEWEEIESCWGFLTSAPEKTIKDELPKKYEHLLEE